MNDTFSFYDCETGLTSILLEFQGLPIRIEDVDDYTLFTTEYLKTVVRDVNSGKKISSATTRRIFFKRYIEAIEKYMEESGEKCDDMEHYERNKNIFIRPDQTKATEKVELLSMLNKILGSATEVDEFLNSYSLYFLNVRGVLVFPADILLGIICSGHHAFHFKGGVYKYVFGKILGEMVNSWEYRKRNLDKLQRLRLELGDFMVGINSEYDVITDVKCWKLKTLMDERSPLNSYFDISIDRTKVSTTFHMQSMNEPPRDTTVHEETNVGESLFEIKEDLIPGVEMSNCIYPSFDWKRDFDLFFPVILELMMLRSILPDENESHNAVMESFMEDLRIVLANKIQLTDPKIIELVDRHFETFLPPSFLDLLKDFLRIIFRIDGERRVKDYFVDDIREMLEIVNRCELDE